ncbi:LamG domain-containing protein [Haloferula sp. BvORR071]|uniref:LamG domain-containing protein n=1 Tax=Haloferula sp. BvORR071 TaxID=1396141 RepID=UPI00055795F9|nr:LamG domain-containing protein [Haloferula sp. BvORR071]
MLLHKLHLITPQSATRRSLTGALQTGAPTDALLQAHREDAGRRRSRRSSYYLARLATAAAVMSSITDAAVLVGLDPATALYDSNVKGIVDDGGTAGSKSGIPILGDPEHALGATFNISFTPTAADLERATPTAARTVLLIEVGGTSNGIGVYLIDGVPTLLSKQSSNDVTVPGSLNDTTLPAIAVQNPIGKLNAGTAYSISASWDHIGTVELVVQPDGGTAVKSRHTISGTPGNWSGNDTLSVKTISSVGSVGGLAGSNAANVLGPPFDVNNASNFSGAITRAFFWNASAVTPPVPTPPAVLGFEVTPLPTTNQVRLHWRVTEGGAPSPTSIQIKTGGTVIYTPPGLEGFYDLAASTATQFTLSATNGNGVTDKNATLAAESPFAAAVRADGAVAWYRFNEAAGSQLFADSAENALPFDGRSYGQPASGSTGFLGGAALFDGGSGGILPSIFDPSTLDTGFTVEAIVKRAPGVVGANPVILGQKGSGGRIHLASTADGKIVTDIGAGQLKHADATLSDDTWAHLAIVVDKLHTEIRFYLDGVQVGSSADGLNPDGSTFDPNFLLESSTEEWIIGVGKALAGNHWKGNIDEIAVYRRLLDDPDANGDKSDSRVAAHRDAWWGQTAGIIGFSASKLTVSSGDPVVLSTLVGANVSSVSIDHGVGTLPLTNGRASITVNPTATTTYQITAGSETRSVTVTALQYQVPQVKGFQVTKLATPGRLRLHWKVTEGEAPNPTTLSFSAGATVLHTTSTLQGFADVDAPGVTQVTLHAANATGPTDVTDSVDTENAFSTAVRQDSPVAWFRFNEAAGTELFVDSADNTAPHNGHPNGSPVGGVTGIVDGVITLDANASVTSDLILNPAQLDPGFTIESVVRRDPTIGNANRAIVSQSDLNGTGRVLLSVSDADGTPRTYLGQGVRKDADAKLAEETWAHLVVVVDALHTEVRWYLDGVLVGTTKDGLNPDGSTFDPNFVFEASEGVWNIGTQKTLTNDRWRGEIDDVVVYNTLLDDPNADGQTDDSRIAAHRAAWWSGTSGVIQLSSSASTIQSGGEAELTIKVGPDITSVSIDKGVGNVPLVNGNGAITLHPTATTTYTLTFSGPGGSFTRTITITVGTTPLKVITTSIQGGNLLVNFTGAASTTYNVRGTDTLSGSFTENLGTVSTDASGNGTATIPLGSTRKKFVRIEDAQ